ncbi:alpha carbonic anhydrase 4-like [Macadamia integrifolia]|uniref:alpha carbonic anhydrase 4-like n=1 Tax=Macadamia integrifolia TaxID=60698 RepID=UPI001C530D02|nr:alpha carbonic anhydrase 4-like [Macadamia integrifolia]
MEGRGLRLKDKHMFDKASNILILLATLLSSLLPFCSAQGKNTQFGYLEGSDNGPDQRAKINPDWKVCGDGKMKSPIEILWTRVQVSSGLGKLVRDHKPAPAALKNRGHDIDVTWMEDAGVINIEGTDYSLKSCHWHSPSEHTFTGLRYLLELHMVHSSSDGKVAVVGIVYRYGRPDPFLAKLVPYLNSVGTTGKDVGIINPREINFPSKGYYRYMGSLTTPRCTEGVTWTIIKEAGVVSRAQMRALRKAVEPGYEANARPIQQLNNRTVLLYTPWVIEDSN